ncbi:unnamed protein product [Leptidea sinapis]|uniref:DDE Tnp4 domain-containing protein n=1 Tax=Leptidea sinapis TaxID=189913 RepID=A0A5E4PQ33_9NEOP|nr:unnamed protein product [Leptidea sinapis]
MATRDPSIQPITPDRFTHISEPTVPAQYRYSSVSVLQWCVSASIHTYQAQYSSLRVFVHDVPFRLALTSIVLMALFNNTELAMIAIALDEEEEENREKKRKWVHEAWKLRESEGEFVALYKELIKDERKYFEYFKMSESCFNILLQKLGNKLVKKDTRWRKAISPRERLAICLRALSFVNCIVHNKLLHITMLKMETTVMVVMEWIHGLVMVWECGRTVVMEWIHGLVMVWECGRTVVMEWIRSLVMEWMLLTNAEKRYNEAQIKIRNTVERTFGIWKRRCPCLSQKLTLKLYHTLAFIVAIAVLHNITIQQNDGVIINSVSEENDNFLTETLEPHSSDGNYWRRCYRLGKLTISKKNVNSIQRVPHANQQNNRQLKNIIVKFTTRILRDNILSAFRKAGGVRSEQIGIQGQSQIIYMNEHLTLKYKRLFASAVRRQRGTI